MLQVQGCRMAHFCEKRACYVANASNKRLKGLVKQLHRRYWPEFKAPVGFGRRVGPAGLRAGKQLDESVGLLIEGGDPGKRSWHGRLAYKIIALLRRGGCRWLKSQVVVWSEKRGVATAVDILGKSADGKTVFVLELKYCSHSTASTRRVYKAAHPATPRLRGMRLANSLFNHHQIQIRETLRLFKANYDPGPGVKIVAGVVVACGDGGVLFYKHGK